MTEFSYSDRRTFIRNVSLGTAGMVLLPSFLLKDEEQIHLTILHTNDMHSHIDPFPADDPLYANLGGMERRAAMIRKIRNEGNEVLLLDAGDIFQGTPYFNFYGGEPELRLMSEMKYDAATMGNHDFDNGLDGFAKVFPYAEFPFICSNYDFSETLLSGKTSEHKVIEKGKLKIGVFGLGVELHGLVNPVLYGKTKYLDPVKVSMEQVKILREKNCDYIICLSHLGYSYQSDKISDLRLAETTSGIDLIIGAHTHTFLNQPTIAKNADDKSVVINQVGWGGIRLGRIDIRFSPESRKRTNNKDFTYIGYSNNEVV
jgi:5'-nucleotidase